MIGLWRRLLLCRGDRLMAAAAGVAVTGVMLASSGALAAATQASITARAARGVAVDWQVQVRPGADPVAVLEAVRAAPGTVETRLVGFGHADGLSTTTGAGTRTTGAAVLLGLPDSYRAAFPGELRTLAGSDRGVLLARQAAVNLAVAPGEAISVNLLGGVATTLRIDGIVDFPAADSLFQQMGAPPGSPPVAPPDSVMLLPEAQWQDLFAPLASATAGPDMVTTQVHVARSHDLASDPAVAYADVTAAARELEAQTAGAAAVGNNLGRALDAARSDVAYARIPFLILDVPGAVLAGLLTAAVTGAAGSRRRGGPRVVSTDRITG